MKEQKGQSMTTLADCPPELLQRIVGLSDKADWRLLRLVLPFQTLGKLMLAAYSVH